MPFVALVVVVGAAVALSLVLGLSASARAAAGSAKIKTGGTIYVEQPWASIQNNFNPMLPSGGVTGGTLSVIYESLFFENTVTSKVTPVLGKSYKWTNKNRTLVITTRSGVKWSDGKPFTAKDVAFTFNYLKAHVAVDLNGMWSTPTSPSSLKSVKAKGKNTVIFTFSKPDTPIFVRIAGVYIIPQHIWSSVAKPEDFKNNTKPVGTGPFTLKSWSSSTVQYQKNTKYWMKGRPYLSNVVISAVNSNATCLLDILAGKVQYTYTAIDNPEKVYVAKNPKVNKYWWPVTNLNLLYFNTTRDPFNNKNFRKALAWAMDTKKMSSRAFYGAVPAASGGMESMVVKSQLKSWYPDSLKKLEWKYSVAKSKAALKKAGYKWVGGKLASPTGNVYPTFEITIGGPGWTDFIILAQLVSQNLKAIGMSTSITQAPWTTYMDKLQNGHYDMAICWGNGPGPTPYFLYYYNLTLKQIAGKTNWSRFHSAGIEKALRTYASSSVLAVQKKAIVAIEKSVLTNVPAVALTGRPNFFDYQTRTLTGFPSATNPYNDATASDTPGARLLFLNVHKK